MMVNKLKIFELMMLLIVIVLCWWIVVMMVVVSFGSDVLRVIIVRLIMVLFIF